MPVRLLLIVALLCCGACRPPASLPAARFDFISVDRTGCSSGDFTMTVRRSGFGGGNYVLRTEVTVDGLSYMDERATLFRNGLSTWRIFNDHSNGEVRDRGRYPMPAGQRMRVDFTLLRPSGALLDRSALVFDGCEAGRLLLRSALFADGLET